MLTHITFIGVYCIYVYFYNYDYNVDVYILIILMKLLYFLYVPQKAVRE